MAVPVLGMIGRGIGLGGRRGLVGGPAQKYLTAANILRESGIRVEVTGLSETMDLFMRVLDRLEETADTETKDFFRILKRNTPVRTGRLKRSTYIIGRTQIVAATPYAQKVERRRGYVAKSFRQYRYGRRRRF